MLFLLLSAEVKVIKLSLVLIKLVSLSSNSMQLDYILQEFHQFNNYYNMRSISDRWEQEITIFINNELLEINQDENFAYQK